MTTDQKNDAMNKLNEPLKLLKKYRGNPNSWRERADATALHLCLVDMLRCMGYSIIYNDDKTEVIDIINC